MRVIETGSLTLEPQTAAHAKPGESLMLWEVERI